jgi:hypothetical protein
MGVFSSRSPSYIVRNRSAYCFRIIVPEDLRSLVRRYEIRYSLNKDGKFLVASLYRLGRSVLASYSTPESSRIYLQVDSIKFLEFVIAPSKETVRIFPERKDREGKERN